MLFDGKPEAEADIASQAAAHNASLAKDRERLVIPAAPEIVTGLAKHYSSKELGELEVRSSDHEHNFRSRRVEEHVASRKNDDGTTSLITIDPGTDGFEFVVGERSGKKVLVIRDGQHEYTFTETA